MANRSLISAMKMSCNADLYLEAFTVNAKCLLYCKPKISIFIIVVCRNTHHNINNPLK